MERKVVPFKIEIMEKFNYPASKVWTWSRSQFLTIDFEKNIVKNTKNGRVWNLDEYDDNIRKMDLAMNYCDFVILKINSSILLREFFYMFGDLARWAQSSRYDNPEILTISSEAQTLPGLKEAYDKYEEAILNYRKDPLNSQFDHVRELMPLSYQTTYFLGISVKQFMKYIAVFYVHLSKKYPDIWEALYLELMRNEHLKKYLPNLEKYFNCKEVRDCISYEDYSIPQGIGEVLFSQLIRHEAVKTKGYVEFLQKVDFNNTAPNCKCKIPITIECDDESWMDIIRTRTYFFVVNTTEDDPNSWLSLIKYQVVRKEDGSVDLEDNKHLFKWFDNKGNFLPEVINRYMEDDSNRIYKGYNAYFPDAFGLEAESIIDARIKRDGMNFLLDLYKQHFTKGYIKDNPNNKYRKLWNELNPNRKF